MSALHQWDKVEGAFASNYGLTLPEIFSLSWRRFRVLFGFIFTWNDEEKSSRIADTIDWSQAAHKPVSDLMNQFQGTRIPVGGNHE